MLLELQKLTQCRNKSDLAHLLELDIAFINRTLYEVPINLRYKIIEIPKKNSEKKRKIYVPDGYLKVLQKRLANILTRIFEYLKKDKPKTSFAYRKDNGNDKYGIYQNACKHIHKKVVLNLDIKNYFESINFSRIVGFFIKNKYFLLKKEVAIIIAQIACYNENGKTFLPQGSPLSPVISNFIGEIIDSKISKLKSKYKFSYSRYADDITLSFTYKNISENIFTINEGQVFIGSSLKESIESSGFKINDKKTRVHFDDNRQTVTGLTVNNKVNINKDYYKNTKAMGLSYCMYKDFYKSKNHVFDDKKLGVNSLIGIFNYIFYIKNMENARKLDDIPNIQISNKNRTLDPCEYLFEMSSFKRIFLKVLFHKSFVHHERINILCEGKTDPSHLKKYLGERIKNYNVFAFKESEPSYFSKSLHIQGGTGSLARFVRVYDDLYHSKIGMNLPTIILVDNDKAGDDVFTAGSKKYSKTYKLLSDDKSSIKCAYVCNNLYIIQIPATCLIESKYIKCIEDMYETHIVNTKIGGKTLCKSNNPKDFVKGKHYTKDTFVKEVINKTNPINYNNFDFLFEMIEMIHYLNMLKNFLNLFRFNRK